MRGSGAGIRQGAVMRPATSDCNPSPIGPCRSYNRVRVNPTPWGSMVVTASRPIHSPSGRRWSETLRSALMKGAKLTGSSTAPTPLPESAMRRMRWEGDGTSPATSGTRWRIHSAALPEPTRPRATRERLGLRGRRVQPLARDRDIRRSGRGTEDERGGPRHYQIVVARELDHVVARAASLPHLLHAQGERG